MSDKVSDRAIEVRNLCKSFGAGSRALDDMNPVINKRESMPMPGESARLSGSCSRNSTLSNGSRYSPMS